MVTLRFIVISFVVGAILNLAVRLLVEKRMWAPEFISGAAWVEASDDYYKKRTALSAALVAGFVAVLGQVIVLRVRAMPKRMEMVTNMAFLWVAFIVFGGLGVVMRRSKLFPLMSATVYKELTELQSIGIDGSSGVIINVILLVLKQLVRIPLL